MNGNITHLNNAIAHLSEQIEETRAEQAQQSKSVEEVLKTWHQSNLRLMEVLQVKTEDLAGSSQHQRTLTECLLALGRRSEELTGSTLELRHSLSSLQRYLEEEQSPQVLQLARNTEILKDSSTSLSQFVTGEQTQRSKALEEGMRSLIIILEKIPGIETVTAIPPKKEKVQKFSWIESVALNIFIPISTVLLLFIVWSFSGVGSQISRAEERSVWSIIKLEKIENFFGIE